MEISIFAVASWCFTAVFFLRLVGVAITFIGGGGSAHNARAFNSLTWVVSVLAFVSVGLTWYT